MQDTFRIDSHKLIFHPGVVNDWLKGKFICPIYVEIAPSGGCNHRCIFCALDYLNYKPKFLDFAVLKPMLKQAGTIGVKSIMFAGEGEPLLHRDICEIVRYTKESGIDVAVTSNGVLFSKDISQAMLNSLSWIRISLNAGKSSTYAKVHRTQEKDFYTVLGNLEAAVKIKRRKRLKTAIGVQLLLIPENSGEIFALAEELKNIGVDYLTVKPYSQHPLSGSKIDSSFKYADYLHMSEKLMKVADEKFRVIFRDETMRRLNDKKDYRHCLGLPFWAYIDAGGEVYACSAFLGRKNFCYGNIYKDSFKNIINSKRRRDIISRAALKLDVSGCREVCRLDRINSYLWKLKNPVEHVNFI